MNIANAYQKHHVIQLTWVKLYSLPLIVVVLASVYIYSSSLDIFFWHDDFVNIKLVKDYSLTDYLNYGLFKPDQEIKWFEALNIGTVFRPISHYGYWALTWWIFGTNHVGFHAVNLFLHLCNTLLVFWLAFLLTSNRTNAYIASVLYTCATTLQGETIFILHTINDLLLTFFVLLSFGLYIWRHSGSVKRWASALSIISYICALLSNEKAIVFPFILIGYDLLFTLTPPQWLSSKVIPLIKREGIYWLLTIAFVALRLPNALEGASDTHYQFEMGLGAFTKYYWGLKWFLLAYIEPVQRLKNFLLPSLHLNALFGVVVALVAIVTIAVSAIKIWRNTSQSSASLRSAILGFGWFLLFPMPILFAKPFAAYYFATATVGLCLVGGHVGMVLLNQVSRPRIWILVLTLFTIFSVLSASVIVQEYVRNPLGVPQRANLSQQVLTYIGNSGQDISQYDALYLVGFPADLFGLYESPTSYAAAFELFLGYPVQVKHALSLKEIPAAGCQHLLALAYDSTQTDLKLFLPQECPYHY